MELNYGKGQSRFDGNAAQHYHFVCEKCGKVYDFAMNSPAIGQEVLDAAPGLVKDYRFECYGICQGCLD